MRPSDFSLLMMVCLIWAINVIVGKIVLSDMAVPAFYYAGLRFLLVALVLAPMLAPIPAQLGWIVLIGLLMGAGHFGLLFLGLSTASPSSAAIVLQLGVPFTALLSVTILRERLPARGLAGTLLALAGVMIVIWNPKEAEASIGLLAVLGSTLSLSLGAIFLKRLERIEPLQLQAWVAAVSWLPLGAGSFLLEDHQIEASRDGGWVFLAALVFSVVVVTIWAHTRYFSLLRRYDANLIAPLTLAMPVMTMVLGALLTGDIIGPRQIAGAGAALGGVGLVLSARR